MDLYNFQKSCLKDLDTFRTPLLANAPPPNDKDKLPGRLQRRHLSNNLNDGPVNFIDWLGRALFGRVAS